MIQKAHQDRVPSERSVAAFKRLHEQWAEWEPMGLHYTQVEQATRVMNLAWLAANHPAPPYPFELETDLADAMRAHAVARYHFEQMEVELYLVARKRGLTWRQIAEAFGYDSAQGAQQRYTRLTGAKLVATNPDD